MRIFISRNKKLVSASSLSALLALWSLPAKAICPVCTVAVGAGIGLSRWLGIDDTITGAWIGALLVSVSLWTISWVSTKSWKFRGYKLVVFLFYLAIIIAPLFFMDIFWHPFNKLWGMDKLALGLVSGALVFSISVLFDNYLKGKNQGKAFFPFQKVVVTVGSVIILGAVFYLITK